MRRAKRTPPVLVRPTGPLSRSEREALELLRRRELARKGGPRLPPGSLWRCEVPELGQMHPGGRMVGCQITERPRRPLAVLGRGVSGGKVRRDLRRMETVRARRTRPAELQGPTWPRVAELPAPWFPTAPSRPADLVLSHTAEEGTVLRGSTREDAPAIKAAGLRWYGQGGFWYVPRSRGAAVTPTDLERLASKIGRGGRPVAVAGVEHVSAERATEARGEVIAEQAQRARERAERLREEAERRIAEDRRVTERLAWESRSVPAARMREGQRAEKMARKSLAEAKEAEKRARTLEAQARTLAADPLAGMAWAEKIKEKVDDCLRHRETASYCRDEAFHALPWRMTPAEEREAKGRVERYVGQRYLAAGKKVRIGVTPTRLNRPEPWPMAKPPPPKPPVDDLRWFLEGMAIAPSIIDRLEAAGVDMGRPFASLPDRATDALASAAKYIRRRYGEDAQASDEYTRDQLEGAVDSFLDVAREHGLRVRR